MSRLPLVTTNPAGPLNGGIPIDPGFAEDFFESTEGIGDRLMLLGQTQRMGEIETERREAIRASQANEAIARTNAQTELTQFKVEVEKAFATGLQEALKGDPAQIGDTMRSIGQQYMDDLDDVEEPGLDASDIDLLRHQSIEAKRRVVLESVGKYEVVATQHAARRASAQSLVVLDALSDTLVGEIAQRIAENPATMDSVITDGVGRFREDAEQRVGLVFTDEHEADGAIRAFGQEAVWTAYNALIRTNPRAAQALMDSENAKRYLPEGSRGQLSSIAANESNRIENERERMAYPNARAEMDVMMSDANFGPGFDDVASAISFELNEKDPSKSPDEWKAALLAPYLENTANRYALAIAQGDTATASQMDARRSMIEAAMPDTAMATAAITEAGMTKVQADARAQSDDTATASLVNAFYSPDEITQPLPTSELALNNMAVALMDRGEPLANIAGFMAENDLTYPSKVMERFNELLDSADANQLSSAIAAMQSAGRSGEGYAESLASRSQNQILALTLYRASDYYGTNAVARRFADPTSREMLKIADLDISGQDATQTGRKAIVPITPEDFAPGTMVSAAQWSDMLALFRYERSVPGSADGKRDMAIQNAAGATASAARAQMTFRVGDRAVTPLVDDDTGYIRAFIAVGADQEAVIINPTAGETFDDLLTVIHGGRSPDLTANDLGPYAMYQWREQYGTRDILAFDPSKKAATDLFNTISARMRRQGLLNGLSRDEAEAMVSNRMDRVVEELGWLPLTPVQGDSE